MEVQTEENIIKTPYVDQDRSWSDWCFPTTPDATNVEDFTHYYMGDDDEEKYHVFMNYSSHKKNDNPPKLALGWRYPKKNTWACLLNGEMYSSLSS